MEAKYVQLSNDVLLSRDGRYLVRVDSAQALNKKLYDDDTEYGVSFGNVSIRTTEDSRRSCVDAILVEFSAENDDVDYDFIDLVISDELGMFISDWY